VGTDSAYRLPTDNGTAWIPAGGILRFYREGQAARSTPRTTTYGLHPSARAGNHRSTDTQLYAISHVPICHFSIPQTLTAINPPVPQKPHKQKQSQGITPSFRAAAITVSVSSIALSSTALVADGFLTASQRTPRSLSSIARSSTASVACLFRAASKRTMRSLSSIARNSTGSVALGLCAAARRTNRSSSSMALSSTFSWRPHVTPLSLALPRPENPAFSKVPTPPDQLHPPLSVAPLPNHPKPDRLQTQLIYLR
jgi:hypothetical protein